MTTEVNNRLNGDGNPEDIPESEDTLVAVSKTLAQLRGQNGQMLSFGKQELGLLQTIFRSVAEEYRKIQFFRMVSFADADEALDHTAAYYEAEEIGLDTSFNVAFMYALCSVDNRNHPSLIKILSDTLQYGKHANYTRSKNDNGSNNPRSPLAG